MARTAVQPGFQVLTRDNLANLDEPDDSYWGTGRVFVKPGREELPLRVGYEFLAARLASAVGISIPAGEVGLDVDGRVSWVTAVIGLGNEDVAPDDPADIVRREPDAAAGIFVFDVWILNSDRWEHNLVAHPKLGVWIIDHEKAFGMCYASPVSSNFGECLTRPLTFHLFRDLPLDPAKVDAWRQRIENLPRSVVEKAVREGRTRGLYGEDVEGGLAGLLLRRQANLSTLVHRSLPKQIRPEIEAGPSSDERGARDQ